MQICSWLCFSPVTWTRRTRTRTTPTKIYQKEVNYRSGILHMDLIWWKTTFDRRSRFPLMEDNSEGRWPLIEEELWWKMTFGGRPPTVEDDFGERRPSVEDNLWWKTKFGEIGLDFNLSSQSIELALDWPTGTKLSNFALHTIKIWPQMFEIWTITS